MKTIDVLFVNFHAKRLADNWVNKLLQSHYSLRVSEEADFVFVGKALTKRQYRKYRHRILIFVPGESVFPDFNIYDYAIGFDDFQFGDRYLRFLLYGMTMKRCEREIVAETPLERKFCDFIYSNPKAHVSRDHFFHRLNTQYKKVDAYNHLKNCEETIEPRNGNWYQGLVETKSKYKFSIAFENAHYAGYTTEKIMASFQANNIPIYWGNPEVAKELNPDSFINCHDYENFEQVVERVRELDQDDAQYLAMLNAPKGALYDKTTQEAATQAFVDFCSNIFNQESHKVIRKPQGTWTSNYILRVYGTCISRFVDKYFRKGLSV